MSDFKRFEKKPVSAHIWRSGGRSGTGYQFYSENYHYTDNDTSMGAGSTLARAVSTPNNSDLIRKLIDAGARERVVTTAVKSPPQVKQVEKTATAKKKFLGITRNTDHKHWTRVVIPGNQLSIGDFDGSNNDEPAYTVGYNLFTDQVGEIPSLKGINRPGTPIAVGAVMTREEAKTLTDELAVTPTKAREYAEFLLLSVLNVGYFSEASDYSIDNIQDCASTIQFTTDAEQNPPRGVFLPI